MAGLVPAIHAVQLQECLVRLLPQTRQIAVWRDELGDIGYTI
jgi:hypothetical protein